MVEKTTIPYLKSVREELKAELAAAVEMKDMEAAKDCQHALKILGEILAYKRKELKNKAKELKCQSAPVK